MSLFTSELRPTEITIAVVIVALLVLLPPPSNLWFGDYVPWFPPYLSLQIQAVTNTLQIMTNETDQQLPLYELENRLSLEDYFVSFVKKHQPQY